MFEAKMATFTTVLVILFHTLNYPILSGAIRINNANANSFTTGSSVRLKQLGFVSQHVKGSSCTLSSKFNSRWSRISQNQITRPAASSTTTLKISSTSKWISTRNEREGIKLQGLRTQLSSIGNSKFTRLLLTTSLLVSAILRFDGTDLFLRYKRTLLAHPLRTKMITGGILAIIGDAIAQFRTTDGTKGDDCASYYDVRRSLSFVAFDMCYRALQQVTFPGIARRCGGDFLLRAVRFLPFLANVSLLQTSAVAATGHGLRHFLSALEQTCAFQFLFVPFLYYPVFFALTGAVQGLTPSEAWHRATTSFLPLMKRNLVFWIPVQFVTFAFVEGEWQIPLLCASGLLWTIILSGVAGSAKRTTTTVAQTKRTSDDVSCEDINAARDAGLKRVTDALLNDAIKERAVVANVTAI